jgi:hypothetical protein
MADSGEWTLEWYRTAAGEMPAKAFLAGLQGRAKDEAVTLLELIERRGNTLREPKSKPVAGGVFELRGHQVRIFYAFRPGKRIVLLDGVIKKQDRLAPELVRRVQQMLAAVVAAEERKERGP